MALLPGRYTKTTKKLSLNTRPIILNGIDEVVYRHDLLDRSLIVTLPVIPDNQRKDENLLGGVQKARPNILGAC